MNINLRIERLVLEGVDVPHSQRPLLQEAVETELARLLAEGGLGPELALGGAVPSVQAEPIRINEGSLGEMGRQIARSVYGGMKR